MKHILALFCLVALSITSRAQTILSISTIPAHPTDSDTVYFVVDLAFNSGDCAFHHSNVSLQGPPVIDLYHCTGMLTVICYRTDTIQVGVLPAGVYQSTVNVYSAPYTGPDECSSFTQGDMLNFIFQVDFANGVDEIDPINTSLIYDSQSESFSLVHSKENSWVTLYSVEGKIVFQGKVGSYFKVDDLSKGVYFYSVMQEKGGIIWRGKVGAE